MGETGGGPDRGAAIEQYRHAAPGYERHMRQLRRLQRAGVEQLSLAAGQTVLDVACGTGLNFQQIVEAIGADGRLIGIELSPEMIGQARRRVAEHGWDNVTLLEAPAEEAEINVVADAALFSFTHDVLQLPAAVANVVASLRPGACVVSVGGKLAASWNLPVNFFVRRAAKPYMTTFAGLDRPWRELERHTNGMQHRDRALGGAYVAWGEIAG